MQQYKTYKTLYKETSAVGYGLGNRGFESRHFSHHHRVQTDSGAHPASCTMGFFLEIKWPRREADHSLSSSAQVNNAWSYTSTSPIRLHGVVLS
jgi:hypothetical protein